MRISDWSSDVCSSALDVRQPGLRDARHGAGFPAERMTQGLRSPLDKRRRRRLSLGLRRSWRRLVSLDKDVRLIAAIALIVVAALAACLMTIREVERNLLRTTATGAAVHWAEFLQSRLRGLDERSEEHTSELQSLMRISYA